MRPHGTFPRVDQIRTASGARHIFASAHLDIDSPDAGGRRWAVWPIPNDPCDEMITEEDVVYWVVSTRSWSRDSQYDRAAAIWGCSRDEAKRRIYTYCYGG